MLCQPQNPASPNAAFANHHLRMYYLEILVIVLASTYNIASMENSALLHKHCRDKERLITSEENDEYLLVSEEVDSIVLLECRFCNERGEQQPKIWYKQDGYRAEAEKQVELGMDNNSSYNRIYTTPELSLVIRDLNISDAGVYLCHGAEDQERENKFNYRVERNARAVFKEYGFIFTEEGNSTDWQKYSETYLEPVTTRFAVSQMADLIEIRENGVKLHVRTEWGAWGPCENCVLKRGFRKRYGYCRLKRYINTTAANDKDSRIVQFFRNSSSLPCKSVLLAKVLPLISEAVRQLPEFVLRETCKKCAKAKKKGKKFRYIKKYVLAEAAHLAVTCPESNVETRIVWKKDTITLQEGVPWATSKKRKKDAIAHVIVDIFGTLYLTDISKEEEGNYTCYVDSINMMQLKIVVNSKTKLITAEFLRHLGYMGFILVLCSFCYCGGLIFVCTRKEKFTVVATSSTDQEESLPLVD